MGLGRRKVTVVQQHRWVFNKMVEPYEARPPYPQACLDALRELPSPIVELGAGQGLLARALAGSGSRVIAVEPAGKMLRRLEELAREDRVQVETRLATAEDTGLSAGSAGAVVIADALHFFDAERTGREIARVLAQGPLAVVLIQHAETPFMSAVRDAIAEVAVRKPIDVRARLRQLYRVAGARRVRTVQFHDETELDRRRLHRILRSISFIGPAMNDARWARFEAALDERIGDLPMRWTRQLELHIAARAP